jgi:dihydrofolate reductase
MRKIIVSNLMSLDGYLEGPDRELDWFVVDDEFFAYAKSIADEIDAMLFGRVTYQMMADYWTSSAAPEQNDAVIVRMMNETPKVVFSRTLDNASWGKWDNARLVKQDAATEVRRLKSQPGKNMVIFGSAGLISTLAPAGLIDEYRIILNPVILGRGRSMFRDIAARIKLKLLRTHTFKSGVVMLYYRPDENP